MQLLSLEVNLHFITIKQSTQRNKDESECV